MLNPNILEYFCEHQPFLFLESLFVVQQALVGGEPELAPLFHYWPDSNSDRIFRSTYGVAFAVALGYAVGHGFVGHHMGLPSHI